MSLNTSSGMTFPAMNVQQEGPSSSQTSFGDAGTNIVDSDSTTTVVNAGQTMDNRLYDAADVGVHSAIEAFLGRPNVMASGVLAVTDTRTTFGMVDPFFHHLNSSSYMNKVDGKYLIRATAVITLQVNGNRFQQGRYILAWLPSGGTRSDKWAYMHRYNLNQIIQLPHVEIDIGTQTQVVLKVPYTTIYDGYPVAHTGNSRICSSGYVFIVPYQAITTSEGSLTAAYTLWCHFEDVKLEGVCIPQMGDAIRAEQDKAGVGPVTSTIKKIAKSFGIMAKIPLLSSIAKPVAWTADVVADAANVWGWSAPTDLSPVTRVAQHYQPYNACGDAVNTCMPLSLWSKNHVTTPSGFGGTDLDEMAIDYIKSIPGYVATYDWTIINVKDDVLANIKVGPGRYSSAEVVGTDVCTSHTPISYLAAFFDEWRGSIVFTVKVVKTEFHSGRLIFAFNPYSAYMSDTTVTSANSFYLLREIIDLRQGNEFKFSVPYCNFTPWTRTTNPASAQNNEFDITGSISIIVLDPLVAPTTVSSTVQLKIEVSGGEDLEFANPAPPNSMVVIQPYEYQSGILGDSKVGGSSNVSNVLGHCEVCIGEKVQSIRQLLKRFDWFDSITLSSTNAGCQIMCYNNGYKEWFTAETNATTDTSDLISLWSHCYAISRGGVRFRAGFDATTARVPTVWLRRTMLDVYELIHLNTAESYDAHSARNYNLAAQRFRSDTNAVEFQVPQYTKTYSRTVADYGVCDNVLTYHTTDNAENCGLVAELAGGNASSTIVYRAAADDFSLGRFVSIPLVLVKHREEEPT